MKSALTRWPSGWCLANRSRIFASSWRPLLPMQLGGKSRCSSNTSRCSDKVGSLGAALPSSGGTDEKSKGCQCSPEPPRLQSPRDIKHGKHIFAVQYHRNQKTTDRDVWPEVRSGKTIDLDLCNAVRPCGNARFRRPPCRRWHQTPRGRLRSWPQCRPKPGKLDGDGHLVRNNLRTALKTAMASSGWAKK